jgi:hypothetical protein
MMTAMKLIEMVNMRRALSAAVDCIALNPSDLDRIQADLSANSTGIYSPTEATLLAHDNAVMWLFGIPVYESRRIAPGCVEWSKP